MGVSENYGYPQIIHFNRVFHYKLINHPFWGTAIFGNTQIVTYNMSPSPKQEETDLPSINVWDNFGGLCPCLGSKTGGEKIVMNTSEGMNLILGCPRKIQEVRING